MFPKQIIASNDWLTRLWEKRAVIANKPALIVWGNSDIAFRDIELWQWKSLFHDAEVHEYENVGHFVPEELGDELCPLVKEYLQKTGDEDSGRKCCAT